MKRKKPDFVGLYRRLAVQVFDKNYNDLSEEEIAILTAKIRKLTGK